MSGAEIVIRQIEAETYQYYARHHEEFRNRGYHVMYGPPLQRAPILFMGYQPGGDQRTNDHHHRATTGDWPAVAYYATENWPLACNMRAMFGVDLLRHCTGLNAVFFRSPKMEIYAHEVTSWRRRDAAAFSTERARRVIAALEPKLVVAIGFESLRLFGTPHSVLANSRGRTLLEESTIGGVPAVGALHLSGARIAAEDRKAMADAILSRALTK